MAKLCLGSVQFGMSYGINNKSGQPTQEQVFAILDQAWAEGIEFIDTAAAYGDAEEILGEYIRSRNLAGKIKIVSKLRPNLIADGDPGAEAIVEAEINKSLQKLGIKQLEGYLLHTPTNFYNPGIIKGLSEAREIGLIKKMGISIYETSHALDAVNSGLIDCIQIPFNVFDQRLERTDFFNIARDRGITVFARSPFLQGLLFMQPDELPPHLQKAAAYLTDFVRIIDKHKLNRLQAAMALSYLHPGVDYVVFGVDNLEQLKMDLKVINYLDNCGSCVQELKEHFTMVEEAIIIPSLWARA